MHDKKCYKVIRASVCNIIWLPSSASEGIEFAPTERIVGEKSVLMEPMKKGVIWISPRREKLIQKMFNTHPSLAMGQTSNNKEGSSDVIRAPRKDSTHHKRYGHLIVGEWRGNQSK